MAPEPVVHQLFSDGVESVSLFSLSGSMTDADTAGLEQRGFDRRDLGGHYAWVRGGDTRSSTATVVWDCQGAVLTLVTDDSPSPLGTAAAVLEATSEPARPVYLEIATDLLAAELPDEDVFTGTLEPPALNGELEAAVEANAARLFGW